MVMATKDRFLKVRIDDAMLKRLAARANKEQRTIANMVRVILQEALK